MLSGKPIYAEDFGAYGDTAAIQSAINASATGTATIMAGSPVVIGPGIWTGAPLVTNAPLKLITAGADQTIIRCGDPTITDMLTIGAGLSVEGLTIDSSVAAASRLGAGVRVLPSANANVRLKQVYSNGHQIGFNSAAPAFSADHCFAAFNYDHGFSLGDGVAHQNELDLVQCQANNNGHDAIGDGFLIIGPAAGVFFKSRATSVGNKGNAFRFVNPGATISTSIRYVYLDGPEISVSGGIGINCVNNAFAGIFEVSSPMIEATPGPAAFFTNMANVVWVGGHVMGVGPIINDCAGMSIVGTSFGGNLMNIRLGTNSRNAVMSGLFGTAVQSGVAPGSYGIFADAGSGPFAASAVDFSSQITPAGGAINAASKVKVCPGIPDMN